jgi:hypothetical protein
MKKLKISILALLVFAQFSFAQAGQPVPGRKLEALKVAYVSKQLTLTPEEAEKFWPVYHSYSGEVKKIRQDQKGGDVLEMEENILNVRKKYRVEFKKVLGTEERATKALTVERDFNNMLRKELQHRIQMRKENS